MIVTGGVEVPGAGEMVVGETAVTDVAGVDCVPGTVVGAGMNGACVPTVGGVAVGAAQAANNKAMIDKIIKLFALINTSNIMSKDVWEVRSVPNP